MKVCLKCNKKSNDNSEFCAACGNPLSKDNTLQVDMNNPQHYYLYMINNRLEKMEGKIKNINFVANFFFYLKILVIFATILIILTKGLIILEFIKGLSKTF